MQSCSSSWKAVQVPSCSCMFRHCPAHCSRDVARLVSAVFSWEEETFLVRWNMFDKADRGACRKKVGLIFVNILILQNENQS